MRLVKEHGLPARHQLRRIGRRAQEAGDCAQLLGSQQLPLGQPHPVFQLDPAAVDSLEYGIEVSFEYRPIR